MATPEEIIPMDSLIELTQQKFELGLSFIPDQQKQAIAKQMLQTIEKNLMLPFFKQIKKENNISHFFPATISNQQNVEQTIEAKIKELDAKIKDAEENLGESEVREATLAKATFFHDIGDKENALSTYRVVQTKTVALGQRLDAVFAVLRLAFAFNDSDLIRRYIDVAKSLIDEGGDWERRNRLKVYEGTYLLSIRNFSGAAALLLESISTFSSTEIMSYKTFIFYCIIVGIFTLERPDLKKKIIQSSDILSVIKDIPSGSDFLNSLYNCQYHQFLVSLAEITDQMKKDRFLASHVRFYSREMRIMAFSQFLESYKSVTLDSLATQFGLSVPFIDKELSRFIAAGRLTAKIDKVGGVVESTQRDAKNTLYHNTVKHGDLLLNRVQKLSRVIDL